MDGVATLGTTFTVVALNWRGQHLSIGTLEIESDEE